jgi:hypothetical protein
MGKEAVTLCGLLLVVLLSLTSNVHGETQILFQVLLYTDEFACPPN